MKKYSYVLGIPNFANYESSAALLRVPADGGEITYVCIGEDRLTRLKHPYTFPLRGIDYCLKHFGLESLDEVDHIATDYARIPRWHNSGPAYRKLEHDYLKFMLKFPREKILIIDHHHAHAASCYYPSEFSEAGVLIVDGMGSELNTQSAFHFRDGEITWSERGYDWGIGRLYSLVTSSVLPYGPEKGFGKVMGLSAYGKQAVDSRVLDFKVRNNGMTSNYSDFYSRYPVSRMVAQHTPKCEDRQEVMRHPFPKICLEVQEECEKQLIYFANYIHETTGTKKLCISGGVALNGRANYLILKHTPIEEVWIQPGCSDTGISFGAALFAQFQVINKPKDSFTRFSVSMKNAYTGTHYSEDEISKTLQRYEIKSRLTNADEVAGWLADGKVIALYEGGSEFGPRALGHRSILADTRDPQMKDKLNASVKFREGYRPYAPVILRECVSDYFDLECDSPYMLIVADVREDKKKVIPSVTHVDGTARVQTVTQEENGTYYDIVKAYYQKTGVPVLLNTSFNVNKEPIVETPVDALICSLGTSIDYLVIEGRAVDCADYRDSKLLRKMEQERAAADTAHYRELTRKYLHRYDQQEIESYLSEENKIADWYRDYRSKYELEKSIQDWKTQGKRILIIGTPGHTQCLFLYIPEFPSVNVTGFVRYEGGLVEPGHFERVYSEFLIDQVPWSQVDEVVISSHEYQRAILEEFSSKIPPGKRIHTLYDSACDSLLYILPEKWPIMNPQAAEKHGLSGLSQRLKKISTAVDFDYEPAPIQIGERYAVCVNYHGLRGAADHGPFHGGSAESPERFEKQLAQLRESYPFCRAKDLVDPQSKLTESSVMISFDDGLKDVIKNAYPVLKKFEIPTTIFVCARPYVEKKVLMVQKIQLLMSKLGLNQFRKVFYEQISISCDNEIKRDDVNYTNLEKIYRYDTPDTKQFKLDLNYLIHYSQVEPVLDSLFLRAFDLNSEEEAVKHLYLSLDDLKRLVDDGFELGLHTFDHRVLPRLSFEEQRASVSRNIEFLTPLVGKTGFTLAYPYGFYNDDTKRVLKELGVLAGFSMARKLITPKDLQSRWEIPRYDVNDCFSKMENQMSREVFSTLSSSD